MRKEAIKRKTNGVTLYSKKVNPKTGKRKVLGRFKSMDAAEKRERQIQYFKHQEGALVDFAKQSINEILEKSAGKGFTLGELLKATPYAAWTGMKKIPKNIGRVGKGVGHVINPKLTTLGGIGLGAVTGAVAAPWGHKTKATLAGGIAGGIGGSYGGRLGMVAGPAVGLGAAGYYKKKARESVKRRARAKRRAIGSTYMF